MKSTTSQLKIRMESPSTQCTSVVKLINEVQDLKLEIVELRKRIEELSPKTPYYEEFCVLIVIDPENNKVFAEEFSDDETMRYYCQNYLEKKMETPFAKSTWQVLDEMASRYNILFFKMWLKP